MIKEQELTIINSHKKCKGVWTRIEGEKKSIKSNTAIESGTKNLI